MGRTFVDITINGPLDSRTYSFLVDAGSALMGLPLEEIEALGLQQVPDGQLRFLTATGIVELDTYAITGRVLADRPRGNGFTAMVAPAPIPLIGYERLQNMRLRVNPVTEQLEDVPDDVIDHPPYML
jgi:predicted aspartyl protease